MDDPHTRHITISDFNIYVHHREPDSCRRKGECFAFLISSLRPPVKALAISGGDMVIHSGMFWTCKNFTAGERVSIILVL